MVSKKRKTEAGIVGSEKAGSGYKAVKLSWETGDDLPTLYVNHMLVSHTTGSEFFVYFGQLAAPAMLAAQIPDELKIKPQAKIVVSPENLRRFIDVLEENLSKYEAAVKEENDGR